MSHCIKKLRNTMKFKQIREPSLAPRQQFLEWYHSNSLGQSLRNSELSFFLNSLHHTYYQRILQVGGLGTEDAYIAQDNLRNFCLLVESTAAASSHLNAVCAAADEWPIASESIDTLLLPHCIEFQPDPHSMLSEAERVLKPEGRLFLLGFNPWSLHGLFHFWQQSPADWNQHFVRSSQLMEWLSLLKFESELCTGFGLPSSGRFIETQAGWQKSIASLTAVYAIKAIKRTWTPIMLKSSWVAAPGLVPGQAMSPPVLRNADE